MNWVTVEKKYTLILFYLTACNYEFYKTHKEGNPSNERKKKNVATNQRSSRVTNEHGDLQQNVAKTAQQLMKLNLNDSNNEMI